MRPLVSLHGGDYAAGFEYALDLGEGGGGSCEGDLGLLHVDAVHLSGVDCVCETDRDGAGATAEVEDSVAGFEVG